MDVKTIAIFYILIIMTAAESFGKQQDGTDGSFFAVGLERSVDRRGRSGFMQHLRSCFKRSRRRPSYLSDLGYGSRVSSASRFVRALLGTVRWVLHNWSSDHLHCGITYTGYC